MSRHIAQGLAFIGLSVAAGWFAFNTVNSDRIQATTAPAIGAEPQGPIGEWTPAMLCRDTQVLPQVALARRTWLEQVLTEMAQEGSYILPQTGNAISQGSTRSIIAWTNGPSSAGVREIENDPRGDVVEVTCAGTLEIRNAFKLPDNSWSPVYLTVPNATFIVVAGAEGFNVDLPNPQGEADAAIAHIAGGEMSLQQLRQMSPAR